MMTEEAEKWKKVTDRFMSAEAKADFAAKREEMGAAFGESHAEVAAKWKDLGGRIKAAMPMDPASAEAQAFLREWGVLLEPFARVATPAMMEGSRQLYANMEQWEGEADPGFDHEVFQFIQKAAAVRKAAGGNAEPGA